jgi:cyclopropane fatty-acyl-phospholipid synthase-like methyltransferase
MIKTENHQKYDEIPYRCYSFNYCSPETLRTAGALFGMNPAPLKTARILEIGCSEGYNLFRFAETYPKSFTLGIDLSKEKTQRGQKAIDQLKLENIKLEAMSITEIDESYGKFDYIICNCVFSWVPTFVRDSILKVSKKLLNKNGIVFINYNTLPGFNMTNSIRELMMFHTSGFTDINDKIQQARLVLVSWTCL